jgi:hypothetical protein
MANKLSSTIYIYLVKRDKGSVRILLKVTGKPINASRLEETQTLNLPVDWKNQLDQIIYDNRMLWEPWIESSGSFEDFRAALKTRKYLNIPLTAQPEISSTIATTTIINTSSFAKRNTMIRKA